MNWLVANSGEALPTRTQFLDDLQTRTTSLKIWVPRDCSAVPMLPLPPKSPATLARKLLFSCRSAQSRCRWTALLPGGASGIGNQVSQCVKEIGLSSQSVEASYVPENALIIQSDRCCWNPPQANAARRGSLPTELLKSPEHIHTTKYPR